MASLIKLEAGGFVEADCLSIESGVIFIRLSLLNQDQMSQYFGEGETE